MSFDFDTTQEQRLEMAGKLRSGTLLPPNITPEMREARRNCDVEEMSVPTRHGPARVMKVTPLDGKTGPRPLYINFHGGGFVRPYHERDTIFCAQAALATGALVLDVDYKLAPEHPFPVGVEESYDVAVWAANSAKELGIDVTKIILGGHSAGGNFATVISIMATQSGDFSPCGQVLDYPFVDGTTPVEEKLDDRSVMPAERMHAFNVLYAAVQENLKDPRLSPVMTDLEDLAKLPPALFLIAGKDPLRFEAQRYAGQLIKAGVDVDVRQFGDCDHGWVVSGLPRHEEARAMIFAWLNSTFAAA
jgi:acetyl esterase